MNQKILFEDNQGLEKIPFEGIQHDNINKLHEFCQNHIQNSANNSDTSNDISKTSILPFYASQKNTFLDSWIRQQEIERICVDEGQDKPFVADVSEGKEHPIYKSHPYHAKVPHRAIMKYLLHYTKPGEIVLDGFCGSGSTGVAALMCGDPDELKAVKDSLSSKTNGSMSSGPFDNYQLGERKAILSDLSPAATFIAANNCLPCDSQKFEIEVERIFHELEDKCAWMYETTHSDGVSKGRINYTVWSEIYICGNCSNEIVFSKSSDEDDKKNIVCPSCKSLDKKTNLQLKFETYYDKLLNSKEERPARVPVLIEYVFRGGVYKKEPDNNDLAVLRKVESWLPEEYIPVAKLGSMHMAKVGRMATTKTHYVHQFMTHRMLCSMAVMWDSARNCEDISVRNRLMFLVEQAIWTGSLMNRYRPAGYSQNNQFMSGVFYIPSQHSECSPWYILQNKVKRLVGLYLKYKPKYGNVIITTQDSSKINIPDNCVDYVFIDPPFGENIYYSDLNFLVESWHGNYTDSSNEAIVDRAKNKDLNLYRSLMKNCFSEFYRILKPGKWMTIEFSNSSAAVWNCIQTALVESGFIVASVSALDKKQGTFQAVNTPTAVKQDLVISAYKPSHNIEQQLLKGENQIDCVWEFIRSHLKHLPVVRKQEKIVQFIAERDPRILFDQVVSYFVRVGKLIPLSSIDFQKGLAQRLSERDGMFFLPEQVAEYDRSKLESEELSQISLFVSDESSAIQWLRKRLLLKPQTYNDLQPDFMPLLTHLAKHERDLLSLGTLLEQNFLCFDGKGLVPEQIHSYLSTNWKELRNLHKDDPALVTKARDRWYVPDPNRAGDLEKLREKALLKEFDGYKEAKKKLKVFRLEAVRAGFKKAWQERDYAVIVAVSDKIPTNVLDEDPKLLFLYDQAVTRIGGE